MIILVFSSFITTKRQFWHVLHKVNDYVLNTITTYPWRADVSFGLCRYLSSRANDSSLSLYLSSPWSVVVSLIREISLAWYTINLNTKPSCKRKLVIGNNITHAKEEIHLEDVDVFRIRLRNQTQLLFQNFSKFNVKCCFDPKHCLQVFRPLATQCQGDDHWKLQSNEPISTFNWHSKYLGWLLCIWLT